MFIIKSTSITTKTVSEKGGKEYTGGRQEGKRMKEKGAKRGDERNGKKWEREEERE